VAPYNERWFERIALLVGCTAYPYLPQAERWRLVGPTNDVDLMLSVLERFRFERANIVTLKDWPADESLRATRDNIQRHFKRLADLSNQGDHVFILLSGHGSQQPATPATIAREPDCLAASQVDAYAMRLLPWITLPDRAGAGNE